jgi:hypothetical protein
VIFRPPKPRGMPYIWRSTFSGVPRNCRHPAAEPVRLCTSPSPVQICTGLPVQPGTTHPPVHICTGCARAHMHRSVPVQNLPALFRTGKGAGTKLYMPATRTYPCKPGLCRFVQVYPYISARVEASRTDKHGFARLRPVLNCTDRNRLLICTGQIG